MAFIEKREGELVYMSSTLIPAKHCFTTRYGGVSKGSFSSLNLGSNRGDDPAAVRENYRRLCSFLGAGIDECAVTNQVHGGQVRIVDMADRHVCMSKVPYEADGIATGCKGLPIMCFTADCVPVLLCSLDGRAAAAVHCGWRSSVADILGQAVERLKSLGVRPEQLAAAIGPAIGPCCFETDDDVPRAIENWLGRDNCSGLFKKRQDGKTLVNLKLANARRLMQLGLKEENIDISAECTMCSHEKYWSHRYTMGDRGSQAAAIVL